METAFLINLLKEKVGSKDTDENGQAVWSRVLFPQNTNQKQNLTASVVHNFLKELVTNTYLK